MINERIRKALHRGVEIHHGWHTRFPGVDADDAVGPTENGELSDNPVTLVNLNAIALHEGLCRHAAGERRNVTDERPLRAHLDTHRADGSID